MNETQIEWVKEALKLSHKEEKPSIKKWSKATKQK